MISFQLVISYNMTNYHIMFCYAAHPAGTAATVRATINRLKKTMSVGGGLRMAPRPLNNREKTKQHKQTQTNKQSTNKYKTMAEASEWQSNLGSICYSRTNYTMC